MQTNIKIFTFLIAALLLLTLPAIAGKAPMYELISYPGADNTQAWSVNSKGEVAANSDVSFIYNRKNGGVTEIEVPTGFDSLSIFDKDESGDIVGYAVDSLSGNQVGIFIDKKGNVQTFEHPDASGVTQPRAMNNNGLATGLYFDGISGGIGGFVYDMKNDVFTSLVPSLQTIAQGVNEAGYIVGSARYLESSPCAADIDFDGLGWVRDPDGNVTYFKVEGGSTSARGIANNGTIVGFYTDDDFVARSFKISMPDTPCADITLTDEERIILPDAVSTFAQYISDNGKDIAGQIRTESGNLSGFVTVK